MIIAVMLSVPMPSSVFGAKISSSKSSIITARLSVASYMFLLLMILSTFLIHSSLLTQSQIPSQAITKKESSFVLMCIVTSGIHVTACSSCDLVG